MANRIVGIIILCLGGIFLNSCKKFEKPGVLIEPGVALTFDDDRIDNWYRYLPLLDSVGAKVTFYICKYNRFTTSQKIKLQILKNHGHEIAFHSTNHHNMLDYVYKYHHTVDELMKCEIEVGLKQMNKDGYYPSSFAYPYGAHNSLFDKTLMRYFKSVRALNGTFDFSKSLAATNKNDILFGLGIDKSSQRSDADIYNLLNSAKNNNNCAILVAHDINSNNKISVTLDRLMKIFTFMRNNHLRFYTISEISD